MLPSLKYKLNKKGLSAPVINWIFVMVAGAVILLFIMKIIASQGEITELEVSANLLEDMGSILVGRSVSENSFTEIDIPSDKIFLFKCEGFCNSNTGCNSYVRSLAGEKQIETKVRPIFTAEQIKFTNKLYSFVESWKIPFNVVNFVYLTYPGQKFIFLDSKTQDGCQANGCSGIYNQLPQKIKLSKIVVDKYDPTSPAIKRSPFVKLVYFQQDCSSFSPIHNKRTVCVDSDEIYFWKMNRVSGATAPLDDLFTDNSNSIYYLTDQEIMGAIFTENAETYECNMRKAQYKYDHSTLIYKDKIRKLRRSYYLNNCQIGYDNFEASLDEIRDYGNFFDNLKDLNDQEIIKKTELINRYLMRNDCSPVY